MNYPKVGMLAYRIAVVTGIWLLAYLALDQRQSRHRDVTLERLFSASQEKRNELLAMMPLVRVYGTVDVSGEVQVSNTVGVHVSNTVDVDVQNRELDVRVSR